MLAGVADGKERRGPGRQPGPLLYGLKSARAESGMTLVRLAEESGMNRDTINVLENLGRGADWKTIYALASALGRTPEEIVGRSRGEL